VSPLPKLTAAEALRPGALARAGYMQEEPPGARRGQVFILFALVLTAMLGVLGLAIDVGYAVSQRRMMQNAADLSAIAGALSVANYNQNYRISALTAVQGTVDGNQTHEGSPALEECSYTDDDLNELGSCDGFVPANATGVTVLVRETHPTFFIKAVPGAPSEVSTRARATARVERLFRAGMDSPFIVCGYGTKRMDGSALSILDSDGFVNQDAIGETYRLTGLSYSSTFYTNEDNSGASIADCGLNLAAKQYVDSILDSDQDDDGVPNSTDNCPTEDNSGQGDDDDDGIGNRCDEEDDDPEGDDGDDVPNDEDNCINVENESQDDDDGDGVGNACDWEIRYDNYGQVKNAKRWGGLAENKESSANNDSRELDEYWYGRTRLGSGRFKYKVTGLDACQQGSLPPGPGGDPCVILIPIASDADHSGKAPKPATSALGWPEFWVVKVLAFKVRSCGNGCWEGTLLDDYPTFGGSVGGWCRDCGAVTVIKLKE
jgi:hypothetical protein